MKFHIKSHSLTNIENINTDCLVCPTSSLYKFKISKVALDYINNILTKEEFSSDAHINKCLLLFNVPNFATPRLLLINTGTNKKHYTLSDHQFLTTVKNISCNLNKHPLKNISILINNIHVKERKFNWQLYQLITNLRNNTYIFDQYKSKKTNNKNVLLNQVDLIINSKDIHNAQKTLKYATAVNNACEITKNLANTPPNVCTTTFIAQAAKKLSKASSKIKLSILEKKDLIKLNMGAFLAVAQGSPQSPKLICLEYRGHNNKSKQQPIVLIGKGITFDTGGNSLKSASSMVGMKYDMSGAASVLGLMNFAIEMKLNINIVGIMAVTENMPGGDACRPEDVVTTMSGLTVEILNTDAEGRLILCEALTYCKKFNPKVVIDIATLTGACVVALGQHFSGLFSNNQELAEQLINAGKHSFDRVWQLPLTEEYHKQIESTVADIANIGGPHAGSITAACFLEKFAENYTWAHLDIAGTATVNEGKAHHATGRPVPLLAEYLMEHNK